MPKPNPPSKRQKYRLLPMMPLASINLARGISFLGHGE
jgi:hypothetical protein